MRRAWIGAVMLAGCFADDPPALTGAPATDTTAAARTTGMTGMTGMTGTPGTTTGTASTTDASTTAETSTDVTTGASTGPGTGTTGPVDPGCAAGLPYGTTFDAPEPAWTPLAGTWSLEAGAYRNAMPLEYSAVWLGPRTWTDFTATVRLRFAAGAGRGGLLVRATAEGAEVSAYTLEIQTGAEAQVVLATRTAGQDGPPIWSAPIEDFQPDAVVELAVTAKGEKLAIALDGNLLIFGLNGSLFDAGSVGLYASGVAVAFDALDVACP